MKKTTSESLTPKLDTFLSSSKIKWPKEINDLNYFLPNKTNKFGNIITLTLTCKIVVKISSLRSHAFL